MYSYNKLTGNIFEMHNRIISCLIFLTSEEFEGWSTSLKVTGKRQITE